MNSRIYFDLICYIAIHIFLVACNLKVSQLNFLLEYSDNEEAYMIFTLATYKYTVNLTENLKDKNSITSCIQSGKDLAKGLVMGYMEHRITKVGDNSPIPFIVEYK